MSRPPPLKPVPAFKSPNVRLEADGLTPRTPHSSRKAAPSSNAHRARQQLDTTELDEIDLLSSPDKQRLLAVPGSGSTDHGRSSPVRTPGQPPLGSPWMNTMGSLSSATLGIVFAIVIIGLMGISIFAPEILESSHASDAASLNNTPLANPSLDPTVAPPLSEANDTSILDVPVPPTNSNPHPHPHDPPERIIDYSKYTSFPLTPHQYAEECWVQFKHHGHGAFWAAPHDGIADVAQHISDSDPKYCSTSVTYLLDGSSSGLVAELAVIAQVAQLAIDVGFNRSSVYCWSVLIATHINRENDRFLSLINTGIAGRESHVCTTVVTEAKVDPPLDGQTTSTMFRATRRM